MLEPGDDLFALISDRAMMGLAVGVLVSGLLWLLGLTRGRAAPLLALLLMATFVPASWGLSSLTSLQIALAGIGGRLSARRTRPGTLDTLGLAGVPTLCALGSLSGVAVAYWVAAACGAAIGAATSWTAEVMGAAAGRGADAGARWSIGRNTYGVVAAAIVAASLTLATLTMRLLGAGEPALAAVGALVGLMLARRVGRTRPARLLTAALAAAVATGLLAALLP